MLKFSIAISHRSKILFRLVKFVIVFVKFSIFLFNSTNNNKKYKIILKFGILLILMVIKNPTFYNRYNSVLLYRQTVTI